MLFPRYSIGDVPYWYQLRMGWTKEIPLNPMLRQYSRLFQSAARSMVDLAFAINRATRKILIVRLITDLESRRETLQDDET